MTRNRADAKPGIRSPIVVGITVVVHVSEVGSGHITMVSRLKYVNTPLLVFFDVCRRLSSYF